MDETFKNELCDYLIRIIKQGYLESDNTEKELDVSEVSCKYPVERDDPEFHDDVNNLATVANTPKCRATCHKYGNLGKWTMTKQRFATSPWYYIFSCNSKINQIKYSLGNDTITDKNTLEIKKISYVNTL